MLDVEDMYNHFSELKFDDIDNVFNTINKMPEKDLQIFVSFLYDCIPNSYVEGDKLFNFSTNASISGSSYPCSCFECKIKNLSNLAFFATMYADRVIVPSPIDYHYRQYTHYKQKIERTKLIEDILLLIYIKPLVLRRIVGFYTLKISICNDCLKELLKKEDTIIRQSENVKGYIKNKMKKDFNIYTKHEKKDLYIYIEPKTDLILPGTIVCSAKRKSDVFKKYIDIPDTNVIFEDFEKIGFVDYLTDPIIDDFLLHSIWKDHDNTTYLTNRPIDTLIMKNLGQKNFENDNTLNYIKPILPLIENANIENLLKIRDNDYESFIVYRDKLKQIINNNNLNSEKEYNEAYHDLILPEINKMNNVLKKNKKHLIKQIGVDVFLTSIVCSVGMYNKFSFDGITGMMSLLGVSTGIKDILKLNSKQVIEENDLYFLWKVNEKNKKQI